MTFDFADEHLPDSRKGVQTRIKKLIEKTRKAFAAQGREFPVIYVVEGQPGADLPNADTPWEVAPWKDERRWAALDPDSDLLLADPTHRLHAHGFMILPTAEDRALIRSFWPYGKVYINYIRTNDFTSFQRLAWYCTKESRDGTRPVGERSYIPSLHLKKPEIFGRWAEEGEDIAIPSIIPTADRLWDDNKMDYITCRQCHQIAYRYPRDNPAAPKNYQSKGRISDRPKSRKSK